MEKILIAESDKIGIYRNFLSEAELDYFTKIAYKFSDSDLSFDNELDPGYTFWEKKNIALNELPDLDRSLLESVQTRAESTFISDYLGNDDPGHSFVQINMIHRFLTGDDMAEHTDRGPKENGNHDIAYGFVIYLNDDYEGGEIYYSKLGLSVKPKKGDLVIHPSDEKHTHGVNEVRSGVRYTLTMFVKDPEVS